MDESYEKRNDACPSRVITLEHPSYNNTRSAKVNRSFSVGHTFSRDINNNGKVHGIHHLFKALKRNICWSSCKMMRNGPEINFLPVEIEDLHEQREMVRQADVTLCRYVHSGDH